jgi:Na+(H+)/acetate symporter ActP
MMGLFWKKSTPNAALAFGILGITAALYIIFW